MERQPVEPSEEAEPAPQLGGLNIWLGAMVRHQSSHPASQRILDTVERLLDRPYRTNVLLLGEPGTGKEGLARTLHAAMHPGGSAPFVKVPSGGRDAAILSHHLFGTIRSPGAIDRADGGTLYLDEVATLPREVQARLSPALRGRFRRDDDEQPRPCDIAVMGATDHEIGALVTEGSFRHDLYHRLARITLRIPALRERPTDIRRAAIWIGNRLLHRHGVKRTLAFEENRAAGDLTLTEEALRLLEQQNWPGNFRELDLVLERALLLYRDGDAVGADAVRAALAEPV